MDYAKLPSFKMMAARTFAAPRPTAAESLSALAKLRATKSSRPANRFSDADAQRLRAKLTAAGVSDGNATRKILELRRSGGNVTTCEPVDREAALYRQLRDAGCTEANARSAARAECVRRTGR
jgi:hypothetical protein